MLSGVDSTVLNWAPPAAQPTSKADNAHKKRTLILNLLKIVFHCKYIRHIKNFTFTSRFEKGISELQILGATHRSTGIPGGRECGEVLDPGRGEGEQGLRVGPRTIPEFAALPSR